MGTGGSPAWAFWALTGHAGDKWRFQASMQRWRRYSVVKPRWGPREGVSKCNVQLQQSDELVDGDSMFRVRAAPAAVPPASVQAMPACSSVCLAGLMHNLLSCLDARIRAACRPCKPVSAERRQ